jgi:hypothetical protein
MEIPGWALIDTFAYIAVECPAGRCCGQGVTGGLAPALRSAGWSEISPFDRVAPALGRAFQPGARRAGSFRRRSSGLLPAAPKSARSRGYDFGGGEALAARLYEQAGEEWLVAPQTIARRRGN